MGHVSDSIMATISLETSMFVDDSRTNQSIQLLMFSYVLNINSQPVIHKKSHPVKDSLSLNFCRKVKLFYFLVEFDVC